MDDKEFKGYVIASLQGIKDWQDNWKNGTIAYRDKREKLDDRIIEEISIIQKNCSSRQGICVSMQNHLTEANKKRPIGKE